MRIGFNGQRLSGQRLGVGRYIEYLCRHWQDMLRDDEELSLFLRRPLDAPVLGSRANAHDVLLASRWSGVPWENVHLRRAARSQDVIFNPAYSAPLAFGGRSVVATHSVTEANPGMESWWYRQRYSRLHAASARQANAVIVPGGITRDAVIDHYGVDPAKVVVIPQGADEMFRPGTPDEVLTAIRRRYFGEDRPYILFAGKCSVRRNIPRLIEAYAMLRQANRIPHGLLIFGPNHKDLPLASMCRALGVEADVVQTDGVVQHHAELVPIYTAADVFVHPSEFEGWSLTTVEAMACGTPVIVADRGGLREVAGGYGYMVSDPTADALAEAIADVLSNDALRADLSRKSRVRGAALNWRDIAGATLQVVRNVANDTSPSTGLTA